MNQAQLYEQIQTLISQSQQQYERVKNESFNSIVQGAELEQLQSIYDRLQEGETQAEMVAWLEEQLPDLEQQLAREWEAPSFSWYGEHYYYERFLGYQSACRMILPLLKPEQDPGPEQQKE